jgi:hypothetical protein
MDDVVACKTNNDVLHLRNINRGDFPVIMNTQLPSIGLTNTGVSINNTWLICSFTRQLSIQTQQFYYDLSNPFYVLASYGKLDPNS